MALFFKKKRDEKKEVALPPVKEIPKFPEFHYLTPPVEPPKFEELKREEIDSIKKEIEKTPKDLGIPVRKFIPQEKVIVSRRALDETKPIFVKIEKYKAALDLIDQIKLKISEAEKILSELESLKENEDRELENWKSQLNKIKENLLSVDKNLFEV